MRILYIFLIRIEYSEMMIKINCFGYMMAIAVHSDCDSMTDIDAQFLILLCVDDDDDD